MCFHMEGGREKMNETDYTPDWWIAEHKNKQMKS